jgi:fructosamine-3-kinase
MCYNPGESVWRRDPGRHGTRLFVTGGNNVQLSDMLRQAVPLDRDEHVRFVTEARGGDIGRSFRVDTDRRRLFVKYREDLDGIVFAREAEGLALLRANGSLPVPGVHYAGGIPGHRGGMIVLDWIESGPSLPSVEEALGRGIARLHQDSAEKAAKAPRYGLDADNFIGLLPQPNGWCERWPEFYRDRRLQPMAALADERGRLPSERRKRLVRLMDHLERWVPTRPPSSLLHGDLWSGNWLAAADGRPYLIDPAVFYGDREYEIAFTELFGGFSPRFYAAYRETMPLDPEYGDRRPLYQLYYLLVHLILFGESYGPGVDRVLRRYAG